jgi:hypothetical protein
MSSCVTSYPSRQNRPSLTARSSEELLCMGVDPLTGNEIPDNQWMSNWSPSCVSTFQNIVNSGTQNGSYAFSQIGYRQVQVDFD